MNYGFLDFLTLIGSLGIFLYGMKIMSEGLQKIAGDKMRSILSAMTKNRLLGVFTGVLITALVQSSSATTLMVVSFVNAGLLNLAQAVTVIMGANVGTTVTAWVIALFGFKVDIASFAIPLIALSIPFIFSGNSTRKSWGEFIIGFAFLFIGLQFLKNNVPDLKSNPEALAFLQSYTDMGFGSVIIFLLLGTILTIIVQSSSATVAITLIMCSKGWISFDLAAAMVLGENIGTTVTANIAALGANVPARRAAIAHLIFNVFGVIWMLILFRPFLSLIISLVSSWGPGDPTAMYSFINGLDPERLALLNDFDPSKADTSLIADKEMMDNYVVATSFGLSLYHSLFNIINVSVMIWFVNGYVYLCNRIIPSKQEVSGNEEFQLRYISFGMLSTSELSLAQAQKEMALFGERAGRMLGMVDSILEETDQEKFMETFNRIEKYENICDRMEVEIANYLSKVSEGRLSMDGKEKIRVMLRATTEIESIGDSCYNLAQAIKRKADNKANFTEQMIRNVKRMIELDQKALNRMNEILKKSDVEPADALESYNIENAINNLRNDLKLKSLEDFGNKACDYQDSVYYNDMINECEHLGDFVLNTVQAVVEKKF
ncbi:Na/Pi cotransporter family protein [Porphyromonas sp.]|uniref:Na/Pi cotransporter family protein n=1 Tax=Porphyromonas sp. TaxID=1924944 RepID=UPI0026DD0B6E|nr:Na/Pi cotransporter family protein [Porphyromonas sp.]MDO4770434.1 Na/Pi cotransporter family protein [Porphyromonas sp.]